MNAPVPSLAWGVAGQVMREAGFNRMSKPSKDPSTLRRRGFVKFWTDEFMKATGDWFVGSFHLEGTSNKKPQIILAALQPEHEEEHIRTVGLEVDARKFTAEPISFRLYIPKYAAARISQRFKATEPKAIAAELVPAVRYILTLEKLPGEGDELFVPTVSGVMLGNFEDIGVVLKTFVADYQLRPEQRKQKISHLEVRHEKAKKEAGWRAGV
jgi:hypothetical protein